jgi:NAD(P)-dependent dehydrogenase (short-subunit alcohol dehydrogenase family)
MQYFHEARVVVTGGGHGLGPAMVEALLARGARVAIMTRDAAQLATIARLGAIARWGDATDAASIETVLAEFRPSVLILTAEATPSIAPIDEPPWDRFSHVWNMDAQAGLCGIQAALRAPLARGSRVLIVSNGPAGGGPPSGRFAGVKRMLWFMAHYANDAAHARGLGIHFQVLVPLQMMADTPLALVASAYARRDGISVEAFLARTYAAPLTLQQYGEYVARLLGDPRYASGVAYGVKADTGITALDRRVMDPWRP